MLVAQGALKRELAARPLILGVERVEPRAVGLLPGRHAHRERNGGAAQERVLERVVHDLRLALDLERRLVANLQAVGAGDVRARCPPDVVLLIVGRG